MMFKAAMKFVNEKVFGQLLHKYDTIEVRHGAIKCTDRFEIRDKNGLVRLFHDRSWADGHNVDQFSSDHELAEVATLRELFRSSADRIERGEAHDFGVVRNESDGRMRSRESYSVKAAAGEHVLYCQIESSVNDSVVDEASSSESVKLTYFPPEEVNAIAAVLDDAWHRMT